MHVGRGVHNDQVGPAHHDAQLHEVQLIGSEGARGPRASVAQCADDHVVPITLEDGPCAVGHPGKVAAFHAEILELPAALKRREKIAPPPRITSHHHSLPFIGPKHSLIYHFRECRVGMVH